MTSYSSSSIDPPITLADGTVLSYAGRKVETKFLNGAESAMAKGIDV